jgi:hypothetical protein
MLTPTEREAALLQMQLAADSFYRSAIRIGVHPFIEFAGLMNEYIEACRDAHAEGIDFSDCSRHLGRVLPLHPVRSDDINEKLECIFSGAKVLDAAATPPMDNAAPVPIEAQVPA